MNFAPREKILDDIARIAGSSVGVLADLRRQIKEDIRTRIDELALRMDLVPREDFNRLEAMLIKAREEQDNLIKRVEALEGKKKKKTAKKTT